MSTPIHELRAREFARLDAGGHVYLDYTGSGLYGESQVRRHAEFLAGQVLGNPHSRNPSSRASTERVDAVRERILAYFEADPAEYEVVFTLNASGALKLVGEAYPFRAGSRLVLTADNHNSVHGLRSYAAARGAEVRYVPLDAELRVGVEALDAGLAGADRALPNLFVYPAQSNFSGVKHPLEWVRRAREAGYATMLDAAAFAPTNRLSLRECGPDFVCLSFYKMFGFPTGVGALVARKAALLGLERPWFGGGTVRFVSAQAPVELLYRTARGFEDGTPNFLDVPAVPAGLDLLEEVGIERVGEHVAGLTALLLREMQALRHPGGAPLVRIYGPTTAERRGGTIAFNVLDGAGGIFDFRVVEDRASARGVSLRTGYFCNPGAAEFAFGHAPPDVQRCAGGFSPETFTLNEFAACMGATPVGAVRVSVGLPTNEADVRRFLEVLESFRGQRCGEEAPPAQWAAPLPQ